MAHEELAEVFARVVRCGGDHAAVAKKDLLLGALVADAERAGFLPEAQPLEQIAGKHRFEIAADAHDWKAAEKGGELYGPPDCARYDCLE